MLLKYFKTIFIIYILSAFIASKGFIFTGLKLSLPFLLFYIVYKNKSTLKLQSNNKEINILLSIITILLPLNILISIDKLNSIIYIFFTILNFNFFTKIFKTGNLKSFFISQIETAFFYASLTILVISYVGGYVFHFASFFDTYYSIAGEKETFCGLMSSTNQLAMINLICIFSIFQIKDNLKNTHFTMLILALFYSIYHINNRTSFISLILALLLYIIFINKKFLIYLIIISVSFLITKVDFSSIFDNVKTEDFERHSLGSRGVVFEAAFDVIENMPFFGIGYSNEKKAEDLYAFEKRSYSGLHFHNTYLAVLIEMGYIALFVFILILLILLKCLKTLNNRELNLSFKISAIICVVVLLTFAVTENTFNLPFSPLFSFFWMNCIKVFNIKLNEN